MRSTERLEGGQGGYEQDGAIIRLPLARGACLRHIRGVILRLFDANAEALAAGLEYPDPVIEAGERVLRLDEYATIEVDPGACDFHFALTTRQGRKIMLVTDEVAMMAEFACQYTLARLGQFLDLEGRS